MNPNPTLRLNFHSYSFGPKTYLSLTPMPKRAITITPYISKACLFKRLPLEMGSILKERR